MASEDERTRRQVVVAGHSEQGVRQLGEYISYLGLLKGLHASCGPAYRAGERQEKVKCTVTISSEEADVKATEEPDYLFAMNAASMDCLPLLKRGGTLLVNSSIVPMGVERDDVDVYRIPATEIAMTVNEETQDTGATRALANLVMLGVYLSLTQQEPEEEMLRKVFAHCTSEKAVPVKLNIRAVRRGYEFARSSDPLIEYGR
jgi:2-oxoglutarate ferredoxin oxidoreductase subunit gamma